MTVTIAADAANRYGATLRPACQHPMWVPSREIRVFSDVLRTLQGCVLPQVNILGGLVDHVYALLPADFTCSYPPKSRILALDHQYITGADGEMTPVPPELYALDHWASEGTRAVRLLSEHTDGFVAWTPVPGAARLP